LKTSNPQKTAVNLEPQQRETLFQAFGDYLKTPKPQKAAGDLEPIQREALFQEFAEYQKRQHMRIAYRYPAADH
jgi:hypothetical protein